MIHKLLLFLISLSVLVGCSGESTDGTAADTGSDTGSDTGALSDIFLAPDSDVIPTDVPVTDVGVDVATDAVTDATPSDVDGSDTDLSDGQVLDVPGPDVGEPPEKLLVQRFGRRIYGTTVAISQTDRTLWIGTRGNLIPPALDQVGGGLFRLDMDTGEVGAVDSDLPTWNYDTGSGLIAGPIAVAEVQQDLDRRVAVVFDGLVVLENGAVTHHPVVTPDGAQVVPINLGITRDADHHWAWLSSSAGLLSLNPGSLAVQAVYPAAAFGGPGQFGKLAIEPTTGAVYVAFYPDSGPSTINRVDTTGTITT
ncbi:MAG: hypothetical protein ACI9OJ_001862, partial [Myxococcota bacterium]